MKRFFALCIVAVAFATAPAFADLQKGLIAFDNDDYKTAFSELPPFAEQGHALAQFALGWMYRKGLGVPQDSRQAARWYRLSAEQGHAQAQYNLGLLYDNGLGVLQDYKEAAKLYRLSAEQGVAQAQFNLAVMYVNGEGVLKDYVRAHMWYNIASANGHEKAAEYRDEVAEEITSSQIKKAQDLARECIAKDYKGC